MEKQMPFAYIAALSKRPNRCARNVSAFFDLSQNRLWENMRQIDANRRARPISMACEIDYSIQRSGLWPIVKGLFSRRMVRSFVCALYLSLLTMLLLSPNPAAVAGLKSIPSVPGGDTTMHLGSFAVLTILVHSMRWPKSIHWSFVALLMIYAAATESLQALVPPRTVELKDFVANVCGIAAGSVIYWSLQRTFKVLCGLTVGVVRRWSLKTAFNASAEPCLNIGNS
jgi:VanZ family protein